MAVFNGTLSTLVYSTYSAATDNGNPDGTVAAGDHHWEDIVTIRAHSATDFVVGGTMGGTLGTAAAANRRRAATT